MVPSVLFKNGPVSTTTLFKQPCYAVEVLDTLVLFLLLALSPILPLLTLFQAKKFFFSVLLSQIETCRIFFYHKTHCETIPLSLPPTKRTVVTWRSFYFIMGLQKCLRSIKHLCVKRRKCVTQLKHPELTDLPKKRVNGFSYPFQNTRTD